MERASCWGLWGVGLGTYRVGGTAPGDVVVVVVGDGLAPPAPPSLRTIINELVFAYWWPTEIGSRQASGAFKRGVSLGRRGESTSEVWFGEELRSRSRSPPVASGGDLR